VKTLSVKKSLIGAVIFGIVLVVALSNIEIFNTCAIREINIISAIQKYEVELDPEFCEDLVYKIIDLNEYCDTDIEILDCG